MLRRTYGYRCLAALTVACALLTALPATAHAGTGGGGYIFYTVYAPPAVKKVQYSYNATGFQLGTPIQIASVPHADGIVTAPDGSLLVGGGAGILYRIDAQTAEVSSITTGGTSSYHLAIDPSGTKLWTAGLPGPLSQLPLNPLGPGTARALHGDDTSITSLAFDPTGRAFYTASNPGGSGNFGTIDLTTMTTHRTMTQVRGAHGLLYDSYSHHLILVGGYTILQVDPADPATVVSSRLVTGAQFDQGIVDGKGHLFVASNLGQLVYIDYAATNLVGDTKDVISKKFVEAKLDDLAPFTVAVVAAKPAASSRKVPTHIPVGAFAAVGLIVLLGVSSGGVVWFRRWRRVQREFP